MAAKTSEEAARDRIAAAGLTQAYLHGTDLDPDEMTKEELRRIALERKKEDEHVTEALKAHLEKDAERERALEAERAARPEQAEIVVAGGAVVTDESTICCIKEELALIKATVPPEVLRACRPQLVMMTYKFSAIKKAKIDIQFPSDYPASAVLAEVHSNTLPDALTAKLTRACQAKADSLVGKQQVLEVAALLEMSLASNNLLACWDEIVAIKAMFEGYEGAVKMSEKSGTIKVTLVKRQYRLKASVTVPDDYPADSPTVEITGGNFLGVNEELFYAHARALVRQARLGPPGYNVAKGKKNKAPPPWEPRPCVKDVVAFLKANVDMFPDAHCQLCSKRVFPEDPADLNPNPRKKEQVVRIYCGHLYHFECLNAFMHTPPFKDGKMCPDCGKRIYHPQWTPDAHVLEKRWANKQAQQREVEEVTQFLGIEEYEREKKEEKKQAEWLAQRVAEQYAMAKPQAAGGTKKKKKKKSNAPSGGGRGMEDDMSAFL